MFWSEYLAALWRYWWVVAVGVVSSLGGLFLDIQTDWGFPLWLWLVLFSVSLFVAQALAWRAIRQRLEPQMAIRIQHSEYGKPTFHEFDSDNGSVLLRAPLRCRFINNGVAQQLLALQSYGCTAHFGGSPNWSRTCRA